jgi:hypothetical protein
MVTKFRSRLRQGLYIFPEQASNREVETLKKKKHFCVLAVLATYATGIDARGDVAQTKVLASNKHTTNGKPEQHKLHQGRLSWEKKYLRIVIIAD